MKTIKSYICDFETTVYEGQTDTEVWAVGMVELKENAEAFVLHSLNDFMTVLKQEKQELELYFHNLKFDGSFIVSWLLQHNFKQAITLEYTKQKVTQSDGTELEFKTVSGGEWAKDKDLKNKQFKLLISDAGQWYTITIRYGNKLIKIYDSLKLLNFSVAKIAKDFHTKHQKLEMEYVGRRYAGCEITPEEEEYIKNDVYVIQEAMLELRKTATKMTIGSSALDTFRHMFGLKEFKEMFPNLAEIPLNPDIFGSVNVDEYVRKSYKGAFTYLKHGCENIEYHHGLTVDVNSLYSSEMHSVSGNIYPYGNPVFWQGDIPEAATRPNKYYFVRIRCQFYLKKGYLPFIQIKGNPLYKGNEMLKTSDVYDSETGRYYNTMISGGKEVPVIVELTLTMTDFARLKKHYHLRKLEILDGCYFNAVAGLFDEYIEHFMKIKIEEKGSKKAVGKYFLNSLYGKFATSLKSSFKVAKLCADGIVRYDTITEYNKKPVYIPVGSAITSYAREFSISHAQDNIEHFIYCDTDSLHLADCEPADLINIDVHDSKLRHWKIESSWDCGIFVRQKTYVEHVIAESLIPVEKPYYKVTCAGMGNRCKELICAKLDGDKTVTPNNLAEEIFLSDYQMKLTDFKRGLVVPSKLVPKTIKGGVLLTNTTFCVR